MWLADSKITGTRRAADRHLVHRSRCEEYEGAVLSELSAIARHQGRLEESRQWAEQSLDLRVAHGLDTVRSLADLASLALAEDDLDRAEELLLQVRDIFARDGQVRKVAVASRQLGEVERRRRRQ